ncbi:Carboxysome shell and ethanolamine utilization microcompartment protein CcmK/EutM [Sulfurivirga caldicuralii]|uniref:Carboxysome shell and ethanolamine utilization microcompartment protein CcmK/EutM n=1 Tax=Sulfurivirga caldicuralii TaxID=364032 RepID=A0A1N6DKG5_9GAMM|nr:EutN/CcmL family microcompartment protein [Sulfurivirga caldicuralii]SIN71163.1 Carboxysome shell and ethanolamine utilization microcompartment protein CcmK/EutM [Sulfurivirga caldicuralii]
MTSRLDGLGHLPLKVLQSVSTGATLVAMDPIDTREGDWVFTIANSAARDAAGDKRLLTDLTIGGIIDNWDEAWLNLIKNDKGE